MITRQEAIVIAEGALDEIRAESEYQLAFLPRGPKEWGDYYVFSWNTAEYFKSRNVRDALVGPGPLVVRRSDGAFVCYSSGDDLNEDIKNFDAMYTAQRKRHAEKLKGSR